MVMYMNERKKIIIKNNNGLQLNNSIIISGDVTINNYIEKSDSHLFYNTKFNDIILKESILMNSCEDRTKLLNTKLEQLIFCSKQTGVIPTIRIYGYFTSFSTLRQPSETSDIAKLELLEKENLINIAEQGFNIKAIVILDIDRICSSYYSKEQCVARYNDLYDTMYRLKEKTNVELVFDEKPVLNSLWILDSLIKIEAFNIDIDSKKLNYNTTFFDSNFSSICYSIEKFDIQFEKLKRKTAQKYNNKLSQIEYIKDTINEQFKVYDLSR